MAYEKGKSKTGGRVKGSQNKVSKSQKETILWVMEALEENILTDIANVNSSRRLQLYTDLMNYIKPKLSATKVVADVDSKGEMDIRVTFVDMDED